MAHDVFITPSTKEMIDNKTTNGNTVSSPRNPRLVTNTNKRNMINKNSSNRRSYNRSSVTVPCNDSCVKCSRSNHRQSLTTSIYNTPDDKELLDSAGDSTADNVFNDNWFPEIHHVDLHQDLSLDPCCIHDKSNNVVTPNELNVMDRLRGSVSSSREPQIAQRSQCSKLTRSSWWHWHLENYLPTKTSYLGCTKSTDIPTQEHTDPSRQKNLNKPPTTLVSKTSATCGSSTTSMKLFSGTPSVPWYRSKVLMLALLLCLVQLASGSCGSSPFKDYQSNGLLADLVIEGKVRDTTSPNNNGTFSVEISVRKRVLKGEELLKRTKSGKQAKKITVSKFKTGKEDPENCIGSVKKGSTYIFFLKDIGDRKGLHYSLSAMPMKKSKRVLRSLKKIQCSFLSFLSPTFTLKGFLYT